MSEQQRTIGAVTYREADEAYFAQRRLRRFAGVWSLWALGVAAVISGDFFGWNFGLGQAGFGGLFIATVVVMVMYFGLCWSIAEMSPALPHTGGAYSFSRSAWGPWGGFATGVAETIEYVVTPAVIVFGIGGYMQSIFVDLFSVDIAPWIWWAIFYLVFLLLNIEGIETAMRFAVFVCFLSLAILIVFYVGAIPNFHTDFLTNIAPEGDNSKWLPFGISGIFFALPFAIWFFLAIEELPLAAEESADPKRDIPRGTIYGLVTLVITAFLVLFLNTGMSPGASGLADSGEPLLDGLKTIFGSGTSASLLGLVAVAGLVASFHTIIYAYGRNIYSLSRAGYYPHFLSITHGKRQTPYVALILGGLIGYGLTVLLDQAGKHGWLGGNVGGALLNMAVFGAVISYAMQCFSFIRLRQTMPGIERPYRSPVGIWGAGIAAILALVSLVAMFWSSDYRAGVYGVAVFYILALIYFAFRGRHQLILSPEEEFALTRGQHGHPEDEGYGKTHVADIPTGTGGSA